MNLLKKTPFFKVIRRIFSNSIAHVRYRGFTDKNAIFLQLHCLAIPRGHLGTKKTRPNLEKMTMKPRSHFDISRISILFIYSQALGFHGNESFRYRVVTVVLK